MIVKYLSALFLVVLVVSGAATKVQAGMLITPIQVVFDGRDRFASITLVNTGGQTKSYELGWADIGGQSNDDFDFSKHMVFAPRRVTLAPGAKQRVRLALRRPADIPDGDYHRHFRFKSITVDGAGSGLDDSVSDKTSIGVDFNISYSIPIVLRFGKSFVTAKINDINMSRNEKTGLLNVFVPVERSGSDYSILGYLRLYHVSDGGHEEMVGELSNAYVFPEDDSRVFEVHLTKDIVGGSLRIVMNSSHDTDSGFTYTERLFDLQ